MARPNTVYCVRVREKWKVTDAIPCTRVEKAPLIEGTKGPLTILWLVVDLYPIVEEGPMFSPQRQLNVRDAAWRNCS